MRPALRAFSGNSENCIAIRLASNERCFVAFFCGLPIVPDVARLCVLFMFP